MRFHNVVRHLLGVYWLAGEKGVSVADLFQTPHTELSLMSKVGLMIWLAREAFWRFHWVVKEGATVSLVGLGGGVV